MKKFLIASFILATIIVAYLSVKNNYKTHISSSSYSTPTPTIPTVHSETSIELHGVSYKVDWFTVEDVYTLLLIPNFGQKRTTAQVRQDQNCTSIINGGFYSKQNEPLGLFISNGKSMHLFTSNTLLNSIFSVTPEGHAQITKVVPQGQLTIGVQSGPLLIDNGQYLPLAIKNDKAARRMAVALTKERGIIFLTVYLESSPYQGPNLADLPEVLANVHEQTGLNFSSSLNLDGGSASAFITEGTHLEELSPVGSFFCVK